MSDDRPRVALFVTCLVDAYRPAVGFAAVRLLERSGCAVTVPGDQTCCGQPSYNSGDRCGARAIARHMLDVFAGFDYVVAPSGSCAAMVRVHFPRLFPDGSADAARARDLAERTWELVSFLSDVRGMNSTDAAFPARATYHDSCSGLRELGIRSQPRDLLRGVAGLELVEHDMAQVCCGFGGTFCVKYPAIAGPMRDRKRRDVRQAGADTVVAGDLGCLMHLVYPPATGESRLVGRHVAEILAGMTDNPAIGED